MRPRFQADADFNNRIVVGLRRREPAVDIPSAADGGVIGMADPDVLLATAEAGRILLSHDRRTIPGHFTTFIKGRMSPGGLLVAQDIDIGAGIDELLLVWAATEAEEWGNRLGYLPI